MPETITFGAWLRQQRRILDLTQQTLADQAGCARITLRRIEADALKPSKELALILLEKIGVPEHERPQWVQFARGLAEYPEQPMGASSARPLTNLPSFLTTFIGRQKEQAEIIQHINKYRLVTLTGSGGVGKTRLSIKVGEQVLGDYSNGVWLVELASLSDSALLPQTVNKIFGIAVQPDLSLIEMLINFLRGKTTLLILDNCEHLLDACARLTDTLLKKCPNLKILATSREQLGITGEAIYHVPSLGLPHVEQVLEKFREFESVRLFEERAQLVQKDFSLTLENASFVAQICSRLDGIPLALELAAAKVSSLSPKEITEQLEESFNLLTGGSRTALPRQQTIRASIEWSWSLLTESEQTLMRQLSVFSGGWTLEAAESIVSGMFTGKSVFDLITSLLDKNLLQRTFVSSGATRFNMLVTIQEFALGRLRSMDNETETRNRHLAYFLDLAEEADKEIHGVNQVEWLNRMDDEHDNFRAALNWCLSNQKTDTALNLAGTLFWFWSRRNYLSEGRGWFERALAAVQAPVTSTSVWAKALYGMAYLARAQGDFTRAQELVEQSVGLWRKLDSDDKQGLAHALVLLGSLARDQGDPTTARSLIEESVAFSREQGDIWDLAWSLISLGLAIRDQEDYALAWSIIGESVALWRKQGDLWGLANALHGLALVAYRRGDYETAYSLTEETLIIRRRLGDKQQIAYSIHNLGVFALAQGDKERAKPFFEQDFVLFQEVEDKSGIVLSLQYQGFLAQLDGDEVKAQSFFEQGLRLASETGPKWISSNYLLGLSGIAADQGQLERAARLCSAARANLTASASYWDAFERAYYERVMAAASSTLDEDALAQAQAEGQSLTLEQAIAYALEKHGN